MAGPVVHSALPPALTEAVDAVLEAAGVIHVAHIGGHVADAAGEAAADDRALALIGPYRSREVAEAVEATAPTGLPLLAPAATWAGVTRDDEPGCDDHPARHEGTVLRLVARDTVVAERIAGHIAAAGQRAYVVAGGWDYGRQLDGQLLIAGLPRAERPEEADVVVLAGTADEPGVGRVADLAPLPVLAFDGPQGLDLGPGREVHVALPYAPIEGVEDDAVLAGAGNAIRAAQLVTAALSAGAVDRTGLLAALRALGPFDAHGDLVDAPVWLWRADDAWNLAPERPL
jgi:hypothetical protein